MRLDALLEDLATNLLVLDGWNVSALPGGPLSAPAIQVQYPSEYSYDATYGRGLDSLILPILAVVNLANPKAVREKVSDLTAGDGPGSLKAAVEGAPILGGTVTARVVSVQISTEDLQGQRLCAIEFTVQLTGPGLEP